MNAFEQWFKSVMAPRQKRGENIYKEDCRTAWGAGQEELKKEHIAIERVCKVIRDTMFTAEEAVKLLKDACRIMKETGLSTSEFIARFVPEE